MFCLNKLKQASRRVRFSREFSLDSWWNKWTSIKLPTIGVKWWSVTLAPWFNQIITLLAHSKNDQSIARVWNGTGNLWKVTLPSFLPEQSSSVPVNHHWRTDFLLQVPLCPRKKCAHFIMFTSLQQQTEKATNRNNFCSFLFGSVRFGCSRGGVGILWIITHLRVCLVVVVACLSNGPWIMVGLERARPAKFGWLTGWVVLFDCSLPLFPVCFRILFSCSFFTFLFLPVIHFWTTATFFGFGVYRFPVVAVAAADQTLNVVIQRNHSAVRATSLIVYPYSTCAVSVTTHTIWQYPYSNIAKA